MKKIGIITFHRALNYGAIMQTYALQKFMELDGYKTEIVDYQCGFLDKCYSPFFVDNKKYINALVRGICFGKNIKKRKKEFSLFVDQNLTLSRPYYNVEEIEADRNEYSYFITGSDQVWSPISAAFDIAYFLPFACDDQKISYAASIGVTSLEPDVREELNRRLKGFKSISVRERSALSLIDDCQNVKIHPDPTLLLKSSQWMNLIKSNFIHDEYLLVFNVEKPINDISFAKNYAKKYSLKVVYINDRTLIKDKDIYYIEAPSPIEFLTLFAYAKVVVTNSFHGTVFSIIFRKKFFVELNNRKSRNIRIENLLDELDIKNREIVDGKSIDINPSTDWSLVERILDGKRESVRQYFTECLT